MRTKDITQVLLLLLAIFLFPTCSEKEELLVPGSEDNITLKSLPNEVGEVFIVRPTGIDDTKNIADAFVNAGPGSTVYLTEGEFYISEPIGISNFNGTFMGAGRDKTEIVKEVLLPDGMFWFGIEGNNSSNQITVSNLSFRFNEIDGGGERAVIGFHSISNNETPFVQVNIENLDVNCSPDQVVTFSDGSGISFDELKVNAVIEECNFSNSGEAIRITHSSESIFIIRENHFINCLVSLGPYGNNNSSFEIYRNKFESKEIRTISTILLLGSEEDLSNFQINQNEFDIGIGRGIWVLDLPNPQSQAKTLNVNIKNNDFWLNDTDMAGITISHSEDLLIRNNRFEGSSSSGILAYEASNMVIIGNNFNNLTCSNLNVYPYTEGFPIVLWNFTEHCTVVGNNEDNVLDLGTNNTITGVTPYTTPPGPEISEAMKDKIKRINPSYDPGW